MRIPWLAAAVLLLLPGASSGQPPLTLEAAIEEAARLNPRIKAGNAARDNATARLDEAEASWYPRIDLMDSWQKGNGPVFVFSSLLSQRRFTADNFVLDALNHPDALSNYRAAVNVTQIVYDGGRRQSAVRLAALDRDSAAVDLDATALDVRLNVVRAFGRALTSRAAHAAAAAAVATAEEDLRRAESRRDAGIETEANVLALRVRAAERAAARITSESDERIARAALNVAIGAPVDDGRPLAEPSALEVAGELDELEPLALAQRPELKRAALRRDAARAARGIARAGYLPHVSALGGVEANGGAYGSRASAWMAGVEVRLNVFAGGADRARVRQASAAEAEAAAAAAQVEADVRLDVRTALAQHRAAVARELTARESIAQARESQRMLRDRYDAGLAPASELLRAAEAVLQAEVLRIEALGEIHVTAGALARATGSFQLPTRPLHVPGRTAAPAGTLRHPQTP